MKLVARLHTYAGLLTFVNLMVFGTVGLSVLFGRPEVPSFTRQQALVLEPGLSERVVAERVCTVLGLSLATSIQPAAIQHDAEGRLVLDFWHANGRDRVTVLRSQGSMSVESQRSPWWRYVQILHANTAALRTGDWRMRLWSWYNEFAMWTLLAMAGSGVWMWLARQPRNRIARVSLLCGCVLLALLYWTVKR